MFMLDMTATSSNHFTQTVLTNKLPQIRLTSSTINSTPSSDCFTAKTSSSSSANTLPSNSINSQHHDYTQMLQSSNNTICNQPMNHHSHDHGSLFVNRNRNLNISMNSSGLTEHEKRCFIHLDSINSVNGNLEDRIISSSSKIDRVLLSPTDFLSLSEDLGSGHLLRTTAVRKDVNLSTTSCIEIIKSKHENPFASVSLERYCESPFLLDSSSLVLGSGRIGREIHLSSDDEDLNESVNGRGSRLSEPPTEDMSTDELFGSSFVESGHSSLVTSGDVGSESSCNTPLGHHSSFHRSCHRTDFESVCILTNGHIKEEKVDADIEEVLAEELVEEEVDLMVREASPSLMHRYKDIGSLSPLNQGQDIDQLPDSTVTNSSSPTSTSPMPMEQLIVVSDKKPSLISTVPILNQASNIAKGPLTITSAPTAAMVNCHSSQAAELKILPAGLLQLAANLAAVFPSNGIQKQIAIQLLREDGTSIIVPISTRGTIPNSTTVDSSSSAVSSSSNGIGGITIKVEPMSLEKQLMTSGNVVHVDQKGIAGSENGTGSGVDVAAASSSQSSRSNLSDSTTAERPFKCELCNSTFTRLGNYTRHKKIHSLPSKQQEDQRFRCDICGKSFIQRCDLARHLHIHRGTEPHRCPQCGKGYIRHSDLVTHQRFHNKEKPFACPHCSKGFCQRGDLNRHLRSIHLQLKPILCSYCHKKFAKEETLLRHINATHRDKVNPVITTSSSNQIQSQQQQQIQAATAMKLTQSASQTTHSTNCIVTPLTTVTATIVTTSPVDVKGQ
ncbi:Zinc finger and BTB domain-containing protein 14 [Halotydeus destructor]|nr:Zinc finger and BTB domain-containing protein 14 [Halotydeus destructor]